jgi:hypothetical protein
MIIDVQFCVTCSGARPEFHGCAAQRDFPKRLSADLSGVEEN